MRGKASKAIPPWDLTALLNAADPKASLPERHLWIVRLLEWLRHAPVAAAEVDAGATPKQVVRLKHLLNVLDRNDGHRARVAGLLARFWQDIDLVALFADFGFSPRMDLFGELGQRLRARLLPLTPATRDLGELFGLLFPRASDALWLEAIDDATLQRLAGPGGARPGQRQALACAAARRHRLPGGSRAGGRLFGPAAPAHERRAPRRRALPPAHPQCRTAAGPRRSR